jgi:hypothetical protein
MSVFVGGYDRCIWYLVIRRLGGCPTSQRIPLEHESSRPAHSTLNLNERSKHLFIFLSSPDNLQVYRSIRKGVRSVHVMDESILRIDGCVVFISDIQTWVDRGHWEHDTRVV